MIGIILATYPYPPTSSSSSDPVFHTADNTRTPDNLHNIWSQNFQKPPIFIRTKISEFGHFCQKSPPTGLTSQPVGPNLSEHRSNKALPLMSMHLPLHGDPQLPQLVKKKFARPRGLVRKWTWPPCAGEPLSEPGSELHQPNWLFCPSDPRPLGPKCPKFVRFCLKNLWEL